MPVKRLILFLLCGGLCLVAATEKKDPAVEESAAQEKLWEENSQLNPGIRAADVKAFYQEYAPELLKEWARNCRELPSQAANFLQQLVDGYQDLQRLKTESPSVYQWQLRRLSNEIKLRQLGNEIKQINAALLGKTATEEPALVLEVHQKKQEMKKLLELTFEESQQHQQIEINRLEAEMKMLKRLLDERNANREHILQERFRTLSGEQ